MEHLCVSCLMMTFDCHINVMFTLVNNVTFTLVDCVIESFNEKYGATLYWEIWLIQSSIIFKILFLFCHLVNWYQISLKRAKCKQNMCSLIPPCRIIDCLLAQLHSVQMHLLESLCFWVKCAIPKSFNAGNEIGSLLIISCVYK